MQLFKKSDGGWVGEGVRGMLVQIFSLVMNYMQEQNQYLNKREFFCYFKS